MFEDQLPDRYVKPGYVAVGEAASRTLLDHPNQVGRARARHRDAAIPAPVGAATALEQHAVRHRRGPLHLPHPLPELAIRGSFRRQRRAGAGSGRRRAAGKVLAVAGAPARGHVRRHLGSRSSLTRRLLVPEHIELVTRRRLHGQAQRQVEIRGGVHRWPGRVRHVRPLVRIAGVGIREHAGHGPMAAFVAHAGEVPEAVS